MTLGTFQPIQAFQLHVQTHTQVAMVIWRSQLTGVNDLVEVKGPDRFIVPKLNSVEVVVLPWA